MLEARRPWITWLNRVVHPLPFVALLILVFTSVVRHLSWIEWMVIGIYVLYLLPYIGVSYFERYALPLLGVKTLLVVCAVAQLAASPPTNQNSSIS